jgi:alpha-beta hydrolase superfamily lysophospholipase
MLLKELAYFRWLEACVLNRITYLLAARILRATMLIAACINVDACEGAARYFMESKALTTGPNGVETPATVGVPFERVRLASGSRYLDSYIVRAPSRCLQAPVILIYHGVQETISLWVRAQRFLYDHCVSTVVFDYTGSGDSSRPARFEAVNEDAVAAFEDVRRLFADSRVFVLGHSMGNGPMLQAVPKFSSPPSGVIVASAFSSIRDYGARGGGIYKILARFSPDWWNNVSAVQHVTTPLLLVHSDADKVNPLREAKLIFESAPEPKTFAELHDFAHNAIYKDPREDWWRPVLTFIAQDARNGAKTSE